MQGPAGGEIGLPASGGAGAAGGIAFGEVSGPSTGGIAGAAGEPAGRAATEPAAGNGGSASADRGGSSGVGGGAASGGNASGGVSSGAGGSGGVSADGGAPSGGKAGACAPGFKDCNGDPADGCEVDTRTDVDNCGECNNACSTKGVATRACVAGACVPSCQAHRADCAVSLATNDGCEADLLASANCGACGHDCGRGDCMPNGECGWVELASNVKGLTHLAVTPTEIYFTGLSSNGASRLNVLDRNGGQYSGVFEDPRPIRSLSQVDGRLYLALDSIPNVGGAVARLVGSRPKELVTNVSPIFLAATSGGVYWTDASDGAVHRAGPDGEQPLTITPWDLTPYELTASGDAVYAATAQGGLMIKASSTTFAKVQTTPPTYSEFVAVDGEQVFAWMTDGKTTRLGRFDAALSSTPTTILSMPTPESVGKGLAAGGGYVYFAQPDGIYRVAETGGAMYQLTGGPSVIAQLTLVEHTLYWVALTADRQFGTVYSKNL